MNERAKWFMRTNFTHESVHDSHTVKYIFTCMWAGVKVACACTADIRVYLYVELSRVAAHFTEQWADLGPGGSGFWMLFRWYGGCSCSQRFWDSNEANRAVGRRFIVNDRWARPSRRPEHVYLTWPLCHGMGARIPQSVRRAVPYRHNGSRHWHYRCCTPQVGSWTYTRRSVSLERIAIVLTVWAMVHRRKCSMDVIMLTTLDNPFVCDLPLMNNSKLIAYINQSNRSLAPVYARSIEAETVSWLWRCFMFLRFQFISIGRT